ncbi:MBL fold metallo-hydrolase [Agarilytica rhodophyticola]|uniref:MBL fold metallo-hydrolase n=1 Tax=Agarilytica rhodophyticola TaxID=1737490 RepID=UPI000B344588|nr:MBL fold metallo-hydrolase [Agarilytica rhodophyticola]
MRYLLNLLSLITALNAYGGETKDGHYHSHNDTTITTLAPFDPGPEPREAIRPIPGELSFFQLPLTGFALGEAGVIVGPDGTIALLDLGNFTHDDIVRDFVRDLNTNELTPARGYSRQRGELEVDWIIITHFHADHSGAYSRLMNSSRQSENLNVTKGVVHRGFTDLGSGITESNFLAVCNSLRGRHASLNYPACTSDLQAPCDVDSARQIYPATRCDGLFIGDLENPNDNNAGLPSKIELGEGAKITLIASSNHVSNGGRAIKGQSFGVDDNGYENARSLVGLITFGGFHYHFGGDLTGSGRRGDPDVETHLVNVAGPTFWGPLGVDVTHLHHHARNTSSNDTFVDAVAPNDGRSRNAVAGISRGHFGSPQRRTVRRWLDDDRLGEGRMWATQRSGSSRHSRLTTANGLVIVQTIQKGRGYWVQAAGNSITSQAYQSLRD